MINFKISVVCDEYVDIYYITLYTFFINLKSFIFIKHKQNENYSRIYSRTLPVNPYFSPYTSVVSWTEWTFLISNIIPFTPWNFCFSLTACLSPTLSDELKFHLLQKTIWNILISQLAASSSKQLKYLWPGSSCISVYLLIDLSFSWCPFSPQLVDKCQHRYVKTLCWEL